MISPPRRPSGPQVHGNLAIELVWTLVPLLIVLVLIVVTFRAQNRINYMRPRPTLVVDVVAFQWNWRFDHPDSGVRVVGVKGRPAELVVPDDLGILPYPSVLSFAPSGWA